VVLLSELINDQCLTGDVVSNSDGFPVQTVTTGIKPKGRLLLQQLQREELDASVVRAHREAFKSLDRRGLSVMDDPTLAKWQSDFKPNEPEWRLAEYEWQRRLTVEQIRATVSAARWQAWFGIAAAVVGALLTLVVQAFTK
jgi:hypothetical protein